MMMSSAVKIYRVKAIVKRGGRNAFEITREFRATKPEDAIELFYSLIGSWHGVKRRMIDVKEVTEITSPDDIKNPLIKEMATANKEELLIPFRE